MSQCLGKEGLQGVERPASTWGAGVSPWETHEEGAPHLPRCLWPICATLGRNKWGGELNCSSYEALWECGRSSSARLDGLVRNPEFFSLDRSHDKGANRGEMLQPGTETEEQTRPLFSVQKLLLQNPAQSEIQLPENLAHYY